MTILALDGFELERRSVSFLRRYPGSTGIPTNFPVEPGRLGGLAFRSDTNQVIKVELPDSGSSNLIVGLGIYISSLADGTEFPLLTLYGTADILVSQLLIQKSAGETGWKVQIDRNTTGGLVTEFNLKHLLDFNYWYYFEIDFRPLTDTRGAWLKINHDTETVISSEDLTAIAGYTRLEITLEPEPAQKISIDDFYIDDIKFLDPEYWIQGISPESDSSVAWTPFGSSSNFEAVDDAADNGSVDDDTTRVEGTGTQEDIYEYANLLNASSKPPAIRYSTDCTTTGGDLPFTPILNGLDQSQLTAPGAGYAQIADIYEKLFTTLELQDLLGGYRAS